MYDIISWPLISFQSNSQELLNKLPQKNVSDRMIEIGNDEYDDYITKVLGIFWNQGQHPTSTCID
jgi:hypothetical protein